MIERALACLAEQLDAHLQARAGAAPGRVVLARFVDDNGQWAIADDSVGMTLINVQMDPGHKAVAPAPVSGGAVAPKAAPSLNLSVLVAALSREYGTALKHLSHVLAFFHERPVFTREHHPALGEGLGMVEVVLEPLGYEQLAHVWSCVGGRQVPSVVYRVKLIAD